jgi:hypothetical protein
VLIPPFKPQATAKAILGMLSDPEFAREFGARARERVLSEYCAGRISGLQEDSYKRAIARRASLGPKVTLLPATLKMLQQCCMIEAGAESTNKLDVGGSINVALWFFDLEISEWRLLFSSADIAVHGRRWIYEQIDRALGELCANGAAAPLSSTSLLSPRAELVPRQVSLLIGRKPMSCLRYSLKKTSLGLKYVLRPMRILTQFLAQLKRKPALRTTIKCVRSPDIGQVGVAQ